MDTVVIFPRLRNKNTTDDAKWQIYYLSLKPMHPLVSRVNCALDILKNTQSTEDIGWSGGRHRIIIYESKGPKGVKVEVVVDSCLIDNLPVDVLGLKQ